MLKVSKLFILFFLLNPLIAKDGTPSAKLSVQQYIEKYNAIAIDEMLRSRIPASITLAQGILESGNGNSRLAIEANNHFGIKCKNTWMGDTIHEDDDAPQECFRKYPAAIDSYRDHSDFLQKNMRYAFLFDLSPTDYKGWAHGLKKAGYATNPQYAELLISFIEKHQLHQYDKVKISEEEINEVEEEKEELKRTHGKEFTINNVKAITAIANESFAQIALKYDIKVHEIYRYNDLQKDAKCKKGDTVYLEPKRNKAEIENYMVKDCETMHIISQRFGVKLDKLLDKNLLTAGEEPATGETINLRNKRNQKPKLAIPEVFNRVLLEPKKDRILVDTTYNNKVYDNAETNVKTQKPEPHAPTVGEMHEFKENLSFFHTVQKGETLFKISKKYGVTVKSIKYLNLLTTDSIEVKQRLIINPEIKDIDTKENNIIPGVHKVKQGQTLYGIAQIYNLTVEDIKATNNLNSDTIYIDQELVVVPLANNTNNFKNSEKVTEPQYYTIEKGETLYGICRKFGVKIDDVKELNFPLNPQLQVGQKIRIR